MKSPVRIVGSLAALAMALLLQGCSSPEPKPQIDPAAANYVPGGPLPVAAINAAEANQAQVIARETSPSAPTPTPAPTPVAPISDPTPTGGSGVNATPVQPMPSPKGADLSAGLIQVGNDLTVTFNDTPQLFPPFNLTVKDDGNITLIYNQNFTAAGKSVGQLQDEIRNRYVPQYFKYLTVSIKLQDRYYSVGGEVRSPCRQPYIGKITVLQAINTAGGFTDFASKTRVKLIRSNGTTLKVDCKKALDHPELDLEVFPGDQIHVFKRF